MLDVDGSQKIWRYMDFVKFADLILSSKLFFPKLDRLQDKFEGRYPNKIQEELERQVEVNSGLSLQRIQAHSLLSTTRNIFINCWTSGNFDSDMHWNRYGAGESAIAIVSTVDNLRRSFKQMPGVLHIKGVRYVDFDDENITLGNNAFAPAFLKRHHFAGDKEVRAMTLHCNTVVTDVNTFEDLISSADEAEIDIPGLSLDVDLNTLFIEVWVGPNTPDWVFDLVRKLMGQAGLSAKNIFKSNI